MTSRIALDALGGDNGPGVLIAGAVKAMDRVESRITLVGDEQRLRDIVRQNGVSEDAFDYAHAPVVVDMHIKPREALKMKDSSVAVAVGLVKAGQAGAMISAGATGATAAHALFGLGRLEGIKKPAISTLFPTHLRPVLILDVGATVDCKPENLLQFALMGAMYAHEVMGRENPLVGLLNIGEEDTKGDETTLQAYKLLKESTLNFGGNAEGNDVLSGKFDVIVCDGFVGNIVLKFGSSVVKFLFSEMKRELKRNPIAMLGGLIAKPSLKNLMKRVDKSEMGGAPLLGVNGNCVICHGSSDAKAISNAIIRAEETIKHNPNAAILKLLKQEEQLLHKAEAFEIANV
ncbi:phosphate acyltransferase PlsX [Candidatus Sumerlaeota bacterium]|nr:phosphate acyltransferase PlsX [Candidatus Sumerlaeota bacterium]